MSLMFLRQYHFIQSPCRPPWGAERDHLHEAPFVPTVTPLAVVVGFPTLSSAVTLQVSDAPLSMWTRGRVADQVGPGPVIAIVPVLLGELIVQLTEAEATPDASVMVALSTELQLGLLIGLGLAANPLIVGPVLSGVGVSVAVGVGVMVGVCVTVGVCVAVGGTVVAVGVGVTVGGTVVAVGVAVLVGGTVVAVGVALLVGASVVAVGVLVGEVAVGVLVGEVALGVAVGPLPRMTVTEPESQTLEPLVLSQKALTVYSCAPVTRKLKVASKDWADESLMLREVGLPTQLLLMVTGLKLAPWFQIVVPPNCSSCSRRPVACGQVTSTRTRRRVKPVLLVNCQYTSLLPPIGKASPRTQTKVTLLVSVRFVPFTEAVITLGTHAPLPPFALGSQGDITDELTTKKAWPFTLVVSLPVLAGLITSVPPRDELRLTSCLTIGLPEQMSFRVTTSWAVDVPSDWTIPSGGVTSDMVALLKSTAGVPHTGEAVGVGVIVGVWLGVGVCVPVAVWVGVGLSRGVCVSVGVEVGVGVSGMQVPQKSTPGTSATGVSV